MFSRLAKSGSLYAGELGEGVGLKFMPVKEYAPGRCSGCRYANGSVLDKRAVYTSETFQAEEGEYKGSMLRPGPDVE